MEVKAKLAVLAKVGDALNRAGIMWAVGASLLLFFHRKIDDFHDLDLITTEADAPRARAVLLGFGTLAPPDDSARYRTRHFDEFTVDGIEIDLMAGVVIVQDGVAHECPFDFSHVESFAQVDGVRIPLQALSDWRQMYEWMDRPAKAALASPAAEERRPMRRAEREVTDPARIRAILDACPCCRLGLSGGSRPYIVPMNFGSDERDGQLVLYFHSAREGRKIDLIRRSGEAAFEMDTNFTVLESPAACGFSARYQSVIGSGRIEIVEGEEEKRHALQCVMRHLTGREGWSFDAPALERTLALRLTVEELSCKERR